MGQGGRGVRGAEGGAGGGSGGQGDEGPKDVGQEGGGEMWYGYNSEPGARGACRAN